MGACGSKSNEHQGKPKRDTRKRGLSRNSDLLVLLLGAGNTGKTTLRKQIVLQERPGFVDDNDTYTLVIHKNIINSIRILCEQSDALTVGGCEVNPANRQLKEKMITMDEKDEILTSELAREIMTLWRDSGIQTTYAYRSAYNLPDGAGYFLDNVMALASPSYKPTSDDMLRCSTRTTGIVETRMQIEPYQNIVLMDVGGKRNERTKWKHFLGNPASVVVFVADVSGYDQDLIEDPHVNRLVEEFNLFGGVLNLCPGRPILLVLNKVDVLEEKLNSSSVQPVKTFHPTCRSTQNVEGVLDWIKSEFLARNTARDRNINVVTSSVIDSSSAKQVIAAVKAALSENF